jgi:hypothetical protein
MADENDIAVCFQPLTCARLLKSVQAVFATTRTKSARDDFRDSEYYMSHYQKDALTEKGCVHSGTFCFYP